MDFEILVVPNRSSLLSYAIVLTRSKADAEDLVQITLVKAFRAWERLVIAEGADAISVTRAWLYTICHNTFATEWRNRVRRRRQLEATTEIIEKTYGCDDGHDPREDLGTEDLSDEVLEALLDLRPEQREAVLLHADGQSYLQIAEKQGVSMGTVMSRLFRGRKALELALRSYARNNYGIVPDKDRSGKQRQRQTVKTAQSPQPDANSIDTVIVRDDAEDLSGGEDALDAVASW